MRTRAGGGRPGQDAHAALPAAPVALGLPDISSVRISLQWWEVAERQGWLGRAISCPARALKDLWPEFKRAGVKEGRWRRDANPYEVLTRCWRGYLNVVDPDWRDLAMNSGPEGYYLTALEAIDRGEVWWRSCHWVCLNDIEELRRFDAVLADFIVEALGVLHRCGVEPQWYDVEGIREWLEGELWEAEAGASDFEGGEEAVRGVMDDCGKALKRFNTFVGQTKGARPYRLLRRIRTGSVPLWWQEWGRRVIRASRMGDLWEHFDQDFDEEGLEFPHAFVVTSFPSVRFKEMVHDFVDSRAGWQGLTRPCIRLASTPGGTLSDGVKEAEGVVTFLDELADVMDDCHVTLTEMLRHRDVVPVEDM